MLNSPVDEIKNRLNIVDVISSYIKLQKAGANYRAVCPFHSEKTPSFFVSPARQIWHCFGSCSEGGDMFKFIMKIEGMEFGDALRLLAQKAGVELKKQSPELKTERQRLFDISELSCRFFEKQLESGAGLEAKKYLLERGLNEESVKKWRLGYSPDTWQGLSDFLVSRGFKREEIAKAGLVLKSEKGGDFYDRFRGRIIFPVFNLGSQVIGFGGRIFKNKESEGAKYINTPATLLYDKSSVLYGLNRASQEIRKKDSCIMVEGYMDAIMVSQAGFENVVATSGTALTNSHLRILKRYSENLFTAFDMDVAGDSATKRGIDLAQSFGFNIKIITIVKAKDPAEIILKEPQIWQNLMETAKTIHDFYFENTLLKFDKNTLEGKKGISKTLLPVIRRIPNKIEQSFWVQSLAEILKVKEENVLEELSKIKADQYPELEAESEDLVKKVVPSIKSREDLLEEHLASLFLKLPQCLSLVSEEDSKLFSPKLCQVIECVKNSGQSYPEELKEFINYLSFKAETFNPDEIDLEKEFKYCLREIKTLAVKNKLNEISFEIKKAETEKDFEKIPKLIEEFNLRSGSLRDLETA